MQIKTAIPNLTNVIKITFIISSGLCLGIVLLLLEHFWIYLSFPYPLDDGEGFVLNQAVRLASRLSLYPPIDQPPFIVTNYPPVFPAILSVFTDPNNVNFATGRLISVVSTLTIFLAVRGIILKVTDNHYAAYMASFLVASSPVIYFWGALLRVDVLACALGLLGLWVAVSSKGFKALWSIPFLIAAIFTRQSSIEAFLAIGIFLFTYRNQSEGKNNNFVKGLIFIAVWIAAFIAVYAILQVSSNGEFWNHTVKYTRTQFYTSRIWTAAKWVIPSHALIMILALFALPGSLLHPRRQIIAFFFSASIATSLLSGKVGSDLNYFLNFVVGASMLAGILFADIQKAQNSTRDLWTVLILLAFPAAIAQSGLLEGNRRYSFTPLPEDRFSGKKIVEILSSVNGPILSEDEGFCLLAGHDVIFNPFIMSELSREGLWNEDDFVNWIRNKNPKLIMLRFDVNDPNHDDRPGTGDYAGWNRFTDNMESAIRESYEIDRAVSPIFMRRLWFIYRPRPEARMITDQPDSNN